LTITNSEITYNSLKGFFEATYDQDGDGYANLEDFINYYHVMEPEDAKLEKH
jgi:hypothetical protein